MSKSPRSGEIDLTFGNNGRVDIVTDAEIIGKAKRQPDGKILTVASREGLLGVQTFRHLENGSPDPSYPAEGVITPLPDVPGIRLQMQDFHRATDGRNVIGASLQRQQTSFHTVMVFFAVFTDGKLDPDFGTNGRTLLEIPGVMSTQTTSMVLMPLNKPTALGRAMNTQTSGFSFAVRFSPFGRLDPSFGVNGISRDFPETATLDVLHALPDGRMAIAGSLNRTETLGMVSRYTDAGSPDTTYGNNGHVYLDFSGQLPGTEEWPITVSSLSPDSSHVVAGYTVDGGKSVVWVSRVTPEGRPDASFNDGNPVASSHGPFGHTLASIAVQADGKVVTGGTTVLDLRSTLERLTVDGKPDATFGENGVVIVPSDDGGERLRHIEVQPDGKLLVTTSADSSIRIRRFHM
ncbi:hypothetical protein PAQ31011_03328 [Pandoraea aquatica]|uniref:Uncharacterized protein n=1 Tax=Pandoraea aquatica TaxID=2508290 RepID=A0A5E4WMT7_9BURK|nr:hypothetical protein [Pandoraea aquatica]VVE24335.1 hypothetical protein PAQ31011_03328 [Pandoraea aquatica]